MKTEEKKRKEVKDGDQGPGGNTGEFSENEKLGR